MDTIGFQFHKLNMRNKLFAKMRNQCTSFISIVVYIFLSGIIFLRLKFKPNCDWTLLERSPAVFPIVDPVLIGNAYPYVTECNGSRFKTVMMNVRLRNLCVVKPTYC